MARARDPHQRLDLAAKRYAEEQGEEIAAAYGLVTPPIDPFRIIEAERALVHAEGADFADCFDGRLKYIAPRFLLCYNTRYNCLPHRGEHHPRVRFSVGHELGHFFLDQHRRFLVQRGLSHGSLSEFQSSRLVEQQADRFAAGLLIPRREVARHVNQEPQPTLAAVKHEAERFDVSLTSMLVRWVDVSDFPCGLACVRDGAIAWGWVSNSLRQIGAFRIRRGGRVSSRGAVAFVEVDPTFARYREGSGSGSLESWLDWDGDGISVVEEYAAIPYTKSALVLFSADEDDLPEDADEVEDSQCD